MAFIYKQNISIDFSYGYVTAIYKTEKSKLEMNLFRISQN